MRVISGIKGARFSGVVLTIGNFDGVHRGHRALLDKGVELAGRFGAPLVVMTFEPHPAAILTPDRVPPALTPLHEKLRLLEVAGAGAAVIVESRPEFFRISAEDFIREIIVARFHPAALVEGGDFHFGSHRRGDTRMLQEAGGPHGFEVHVVDPIRVALGGHPDTVISSSLVRHLLSSGNVDRAALCLGRPYALFGTVSRGAGRGRTMGFPTANLTAENQLVPAEGVYAGVASAGASSTSEGPEPGDRRKKEAETTGPTDRGTGGQENEGGEGLRDSGTNGIGLPVPAAISIGRTPTFAGHELLIEAHLLDFEGDLYDRPLRLDFLDWIRGQERFPTVEALREQIARDVARVREATHEHR